MQTPEKPKQTRPVRRCGKFDQEFKTEALRMVAERGRPSGPISLCGGSVTQREPKADLSLEGSTEESSGQGEHWPGQRT